MNYLLGRMTLQIWEWQYRYPGRCRAAGWTIIGLWAIALVMTLRFLWRAMA